MGTFFRFPYPAEDDFILLKSQEIVGRKILHTQIKRMFRSSTECGSQPVAAGTYDVTATYTNKEARGVDAFLGTLTSNTVPMVIE